MALFLKVSNSLKNLADDLSQELKAAPNSVFEPHLVITQTEGMNNWLKLQIAAHLGITANVRFLKPNDLVHKLYYMLGGPYNEVLSMQNLNWLLFKLLGEREFQLKFPATAAYFSGDGTDKEIKRMALAEKLSDLFDQYQIYRPDMIREWNIAIAGDLEANEWQQYLWVKARQISENSLPDKTTIGAYILQAIRVPEKQATLVSRMPAIHLFGLSITTAYHLQILYDLSSHIEVYFHIINPAPQTYWFDDRSEKQLAIWRRKGSTKFADGIAGNPLLTSWGKVIQETFGMFFQHDEFLNALEDVGIVEPSPDNLLYKIQHDIFSAATDGRNKINIKDLTDGSITISSCYTVAREVEVLYNYLVFLIDKKKAALSARDIVVMVSDIDSYAPYVKAVFNNAPHKFRYTIADESFAEGDNIFQALHSILLMNESNFKAETVMQLLDSSFVRNRFFLSDIDRIRSVVNAANIRFGIDGDKENETHFVSWRYGIRRIMYGICMSGEEEHDEGADSFFPVDILEGSSAQELVRFSHFIEILIDSIDKRKGDRTLVEWVNYIEYVLHNLVYEQDDDPDENYIALTDQLAEYNVVNKYMADKVPFDVFSHSFLKTIDTTSRTGLFAIGGITFCSLIPMRSIPFKVVCLLGLGFDKFPRKEQASGFNLMEKSRQRGDRNVKENDKHLFLETILSAQQFLYLSYVGRSAKDNSDMPPSTVVDELIDYIEDGMENSEGARQKLVTTHPLHGFSAKYSGGSGLTSYLNSYSTDSKIVTSPGKLPEPYVFDEIDIEELIRFFRNPFKAYYNKVLGIFYNEDDVLLQETELFSLDQLQSWKLKNKSLTLDEQERKQLMNQLVRKGNLPLGNMAEVSMITTEDAVAPVREFFNAVVKGKTASLVPVTINVGGHLLTGIIEQVYDRTLVQVSWSKKETKYLVAAYIRYLAGMASGKISELYFISEKRQNAFKATRLAPDDAVVQLAELIELYKKGFDAIVPFFPDFDFTLIQLDKMTPESLPDVIEKKVENESLLNDAYVTNEYHEGFFSREGIGENFIEIYRKLLTHLVSLLPEYYEK